MNPKMRLFNIGNKELRQNIVHLILLSLMTAVPWNKALQQKCNNLKSSWSSALCCNFLSQYLINPCQYWYICVQPIISANQYIGRALLYIVKIQNANSFVFFKLAYLCSWFKKNPHEYQDQGFHSETLLLRKAIIVIHYSWR